MPRLRYFDGRDWTEHYHPLPAPPAPEPDVSEMAEALLQVFVTAYNHAYSDAVVAGELPTTAQAANAVVQAVTQHYKDNTDVQKFVLAMVVIKAIEKLPAGDHPSYFDLKNPDRRDRG